MLGSLNSSATDRITEFISIPAEEWTEEPESDDDQCQLAIALAESDELTAAEACDEDSEEVKIMTLKEANAASAALMLFLEENKCAASLQSQKEVSTQLSRMTFTARMTVAQASIPSRFVTPGSGLPLTGLSTEACSVVPTRTRADSEPASADSDRCRHAGTLQP